MLTANDITVTINIIKDAIFSLSPCTPFRGFKLKYRITDINIATINPMVVHANVGEFVAIFASTIEIKYRQNQ